MKAAKKKLFVKALAQLLADDEVVGVIPALSCDFGPLKRAWAILRSTTPLHGFPSVEEAEKILTEFLE
jgi:hypothetical protein